MPDSSSYKIISVTGAHSSIGKTTLASIILKSLKGFGAIKFTKSSLFTSVTDEPDTILQSGKDTAVLSGSGAEHVVWVQCPAAGLKDALPVAISKLGKLKGIVVEGNSPVDHLNPDLVVFIIGNDGYIKPTAADVSKRADIIVINCEENSAHFPLTQYMKEKTNVFYIDLVHKKGEIDKFIACVKEYIRETD